MTKKISGASITNSRAAFPIRQARAGNRNSLSWRYGTSSRYYKNKNAFMIVRSCIPVVPSADLEKSLRFWVEGLGLAMDRAIKRDGRLVGCMVQNERLHFWLNQR